MKFDDDAKLDTSQIDDQRGRPSSGGGGFGGSRRSAGMGGGGMGGLPIGKKGGLGGIVLMLLMAFVLPKLLGGGGGGGLSGYDNNTPFGQADPVSANVADAAPGEVTQACKTGADANRRQDCRIAAVVNDVNAFWGEVYAANNLPYQVAKTVYFTDEVQTGCGPATAAVGPFYCPADSKAYLDLGFFNELQTKFGATGGPFAEAYVVAHEYGHHIQNLTGISEKVQRSGDRTGPESAAVRLELQADCYAGAWASNATRGPDPLIVELTNEDIAAGLDAAARVGDDFIQKKFQGSVNPESWTHGSSEQRQKWFNKGFKTGEPSACDTFSGGI